MYILLTTFIICIPSYKPSADRKTLIISGLNEVVDKESYQSTGSTNVYTHIEIEDGIIGLGQSALSHCEELISINLPTSLKTIGEGCFSYCPKLFSLKIPKGIERLNSGMFSCCYSFQLIDIPSSLKQIVSSTFGDCNSLNKFITHDGGWFSTLNNGTFLVLNKTIGVACTAHKNLVIPSEIETLSDYFMNGITSVSSITFTGNKLKYIHDNSFKGAKSLSSLTLPSGVVSVGDSFIASSGVAYLKLPSTLSILSSSAFDKASNLARVEIDGECSAVHQDSQGVIYSKDQTTVIFLPPDIQRFNVTKSVQNLNIEALKNKRNLTELFVDDENEKFSSDGCALYSKDMSTLICGIGGIKNVRVASECKKIGENAYSNMNIERLEFLGNNVTEILNYAFSGSSLHTVIFSEGIKTLFYMSFNSAKLKEISLPSTVERLNQQCFQGNPVTTLDMSECKSLISISHAAFVMCTSLTKVILPPNMPYIGSSQFESCRSLKTISIPPSVSEIIEGGFAKSGLTSIKFEGNNITKIGNKAFTGTKLIEIEIPNSVTEIGVDALSNCPSLTSIIIGKDSSLSKINNDMIRGSNSLVSIWLPKTLSAISVTALGQAMGLKSITFDGENRQYVGRDGLVVDLKKKEAIAVGGGCSSVRIGDDILSIGPSAFLNCVNLLEVTFSPGSKMQTVGKSTFLGCSSLSSISLPRFMERIEAYAFSDCASLMTVDFGGSRLPRSLASIGEGAFAGCVALESVELPPSLRSIGKLAFSNCRSLTRLDLGRNLTEIGDNSVSGCKSLKAIWFCVDSDPKTDLSGISDTAFSGIPSDALIYVTDDLRRTGLGGRDVVRVLDGDCSMPTDRFTLVEDYTPSNVTAAMLVVTYADSHRFAELDDIEGGHK